MCLKVCSHSGKYRPDSVTENGMHKLTCQHAHHGKQDLLYTLHRAPPLSTALIAHGIIAWGMQDGDADSPVGIDCKIQRQPCEPRHGATVLGKLFRGPAVCTAVTGHFLLAQIPERPTSSRPDLLGTDQVLWSLADKGAWDQVYLALTSHKWTPPCYRFL